MSGYEHRATIQIRRALRELDDAIEEMQQAAEPTPEELASITRTLRNARARLRSLKTLGVVDP